jgi:hypothetical protein
MSRRLPMCLLVSSLMSVASLGSAASAPQVLYTNKLQQPLPLSNVDKPGTILKSRLFITNDQGKNWLMLHEMQVAADATELPKFPFRVDADGEYGVMPCTSYRNGVIEPDPKPAQPPPYLIIVDTLAPVIKLFDATLIGRSAQKAIVRVTWSITDLHLDKEPIAIEASTDQGTRYTTIHRGDKDGAAELVVPVTAESREVHLRLVITDLARNVTISPSRSFNFEPIKTEKKPEPVAPADPAQALAQAVATLPSLAEVGAGPIKPLPTKTIPPPSQVNPTAAVAPLPGAVASEPILPPADTAPSVPTTTAPADKPAIVVDGKAYEPVTPPPVTTPNKPVDVVLANNNVDQEFYKKLSEQRAKPPENPRTTNRFNQPTQPIPVVKSSEPIDGRRAPASIIPNQNKDPLKTLTDARVLVISDNIDAACDLYESLRFSSIGKTALHEQVNILLAKNRPRDAITAIMSAPVEIVTDEIHLDHARALLATQRPDEVMAAVSTIPADAPESRPAFLLIVKSYLALGRTTEANRGLNYLAKGNDDVANEARALLGR